MSDIFGSMPPRRGPEPRSDRGRRVLIPTIATLGALLAAGSLFVSLWTERLWFHSVDFQGVFTKVLLTRVGLFVVFGLVAGLVVGANVWLAHRNRPNPLGLRRDDPAARYRLALAPVARVALVAVSLFVAFFAGLIGSSRWKTFQLWWNGTTFDRKDPHFGKDVGFYVFDMPWLEFLVSFGFGLIMIATLAAVFTHYVFGGIRIGQKGPRFTRAAQVQVAVLVGLALLVRAVNYWLDRYAMAYGSSGLFDGIKYTDANAQIPAKNILVIVAVLCAVMFFSTIFLRSWTLPALGLGLWFVASLLIGAAWPAIMQQFQVNPSEPDREGPYLAKNIESTREAFGISDVQTMKYSAKTELTPQELNASAESRVSTRLLDPTLISPAFQQLQQVRGYYNMQTTLDVDRYAIGDDPKPQDVIIAAREVDLDGLQPAQRTWSNDHTVYTHGYGVIAAYGNKRGSQGEPQWVAKDIPPTGELEFSRPPRIYFGEKSPSYSIVGRPDGKKPIEVDTPRGGGSSEAEGTGDTSANTYDGQGGVAMGSLFRQALYAFKFAEPKLVLSDRVNENSKIIYDRHPRDRVRKVAPWLTLDGDTYPAVVDGKVVWVVDGYTTSNSYPYSESRSLATATSDSLTDGDSQIALPTDQVNYLRNSVKAVVDAYDGTVTLYEWDTKDPILKTWKKVFPGVVEPKSKISPALLQHLRYPVDLFKVQRDVLSRYHVTNAQTFYEDGERWKVPEDPSAKGKTQPPYYLSTTRPGEEETKFSLTSVYLPNNRQNLASFMSVNSEASDTGNYGKLQLLELPSETRVGGPNQIAAQFSSDADVRAALLQYEQSKDTRILRGNLLTLPVGGAMLYVQPIYIQRDGEGSYPVLNLITATFGDGVGVGQTLDDALRSALGLKKDRTPEPETGGSSGEPSQSKTAMDYLDEASDLYEQAQAALEDGDLATYQKRIDAMAAALEEAQKRVVE